MGYVTTHTGTKKAGMKVSGSQKPSMGKSKSGGSLKNGVATAKSITMAKKRN